MGDEGNEKSFSQKAKIDTIKDLASETFPTPNSESIINMTVNAENSIVLQSLNISSSNRHLPDEQILINNLLMNYDPGARPVFNASHPIVIKFSFSLIQICDMVTTPAGKL